MCRHAQIDRSSQKVRAVKLAAREPLPVDPNRPPQVKSCESCPNAPSDCVSLTYQQIYDDNMLDVTNTIINQFVWQSDTRFNAVSPYIVPEIEKEFTIPINRTLFGTQPDARSQVYGYNDDQTLNLTGGRDASYNPDFTEFRLKYNAATKGVFYDPSGLVTKNIETLTPDVVKRQYDKILSYFGSRGFDLQKQDTFNKFSDQFIWNNSNGQQQQEFFGLPAYIALRLIWNTDKKCKRKIPEFVDLHATANNVNYFVLDTYESDESQRQNGHGYPLRIPITTDFCGRFQTEYNLNPIAYFDEKNKVLTIHVPENGQQHFLTSRIVNTGNPDLDVNYQEYLTGFNASFAVLRRNSKNEFVPTKLRCADLFAQVSETIDISSNVISFGEPQTYTATLPIRANALPNPLIYYTGVVAAKMNGGSPSYDVNIIPMTFLNAYNFFIDPVQIPEEGGYAQGDLPATKVIEQYGALTTITQFDVNYDSISLNLPIPMLRGTYYPETNLLPIPTEPTNEEAIQRVANHEFTHQTQTLYLAMPAEGQATGIELDYRISNETFALSRISEFIRSMLRVSRGTYGPSNNDLQINTFGMGIFWKYLQDQFDFNNQLMRRSQDILLSETLGPLAKSNDFPDLTLLFYSNNNGVSASLDQALRELFNKNLKDVWTDFSVSSVFLRNNKSIPDQYKNYWPYFIYDSRYVGYSQIFQAASNSNRSQFANWWELLDTNGIVPANWGAVGGAFRGQTFVRTLPPVFDASIPDLRTVAFNVPNTTNSITVTITAGEWRIILCQFTPDGTETGLWAQEGPIEIIGSGNVTFTPSLIPGFTSTGNTRLVCVNVNMTGDGRSLADYFSAQENTGTINIVSA